jgi:hypothetical protein
MKETSEIDCPTVAQWKPDGGKDSLHHRATFRPLCGREPNEAMTSASAVSDSKAVGKQNNIRQRRGLKKMTSQSHSAAYP